MRVSSSQRRLTDFRPAGGLLDLVNHEDGAGGAGLEPRRLPLRRDPLRAAERRLVGAHETDGEREIPDRLGDERRLAHLPRPGDHLDEPPGLGESLGQLGRLRTAVWKCGILTTHHIE